MNFRLLLRGLLATTLACFMGSCQKPSGWAVYYGSQTPTSVLEAYQLVVLDRLYPFDIAPLKGKGRQVLGYVSLGEVTVNDPWFARAQEGGIVGKENTFWKGSFTVDIRQPLWQQILLEEVLPPLFARGFDGVMLDTLDSPLLLEQLQPPQLGMIDAAERLVASIREAYPQAVIVQNRGYTALERTAPLLNYVLAESTFTAYDGATQKHYLRNEKDQRYALDFIHKAKLISPGLKVLGLEYWDITDAETIARLKEMMIKNKMLPYISTLALDKVHTYPKQKRIAK